MARVNDTNSKRSKGRTGRAEEQEGGFPIIPVIGSIAAIAAAGVASGGAFVARARAEQERARRPVIILPIALALVGLLGMLLFARWRMGDGSMDEHAADPETLARSAERSMEAAEIAGSPPPEPPAFEGDVTPSRS